MNIWLAEIWQAWRTSLRRPGYLLLASGVLALGAKPSKLVNLVLRSGLIQIVIGLVIGVGIVLGVSGLLKRMLFELVGRSNTFDPVAIVSVCVVLGIAGLLACALPALRAGRVQSMNALRGE